MAPPLLYTRMGCTRIPPFLDAIDFFFFKNNLSFTRRGNVNVAWFSMAYSEGDEILLFIDVKRHIIFYFYVLIFLLLFINVLVYIIFYFI